jgi:hypothetical protein
MQVKGLECATFSAYQLVQKISLAQMDERRRNDLCYSCDAKWSREHVCDLYSTRRG